MAQEKANALERRLRRRLLQQQDEQQQKRRRHWAGSWDGKRYGYGAGRAHPCVEFAPCPFCRAPPGLLCRGPYGPKFSTHHSRRQEYAAMKRRVLEKSG